MNFQNRSSRFASLRTFAQGMFNLNDPRWGRGEDKGDDAHRPEDRGSAGPERRPGPGGPGQSSDLDELWRDLNRRLSGFFGGGSGGGLKGVGSRTCAVQALAWRYWEVLHLPSGWVLASSS